MQTVNYLPVLQFICQIVHIQILEGIAFHVNVDTNKVVSTTEDAYLSFCLDPYLKVEVTPPWGTLDFSHPRVHTLARGLAPAVLRFGGTDADFSFFYDVSDPVAQQAINRQLKLLYPLHGPRKVLAIFPQDVDNLVNLARSAGGKLLYDLSIQPRFGYEWDPSNAIELLNYMQRKGYAEYVDFEMGNEPPYSQVHGHFNATGTRIAKDFLILRDLLNHKTLFNKAHLVGPDVETPRDGKYSGEQVVIIKDFVKVAKDNISAVTVHHYYFAGPGKHIEDFYNLTYFHYFESTLSLLRYTLYTAAGKPISIWLGETSDASSEGTPNITNTYASGFFWLDKLGVSAKYQISLVARQDFYGANYPLVNNQLNPNPDYWLSYIFKKLVGRKVLHAYISPNTGSEYIRVYSHCTSPRSGYKNGSVVIYAINLNPNVDGMLEFNNSSGQFHSYYLLPVNGNIQSEDVMLNGKVLKMVNDQVLPDIKPIVNFSNSFKLKVLSFAFLVFPSLNVSICI